MPMKIDILSEKTNKTLSRREFEFRIDHAGEKTPSRAEIQAKIGAQFDADLSTVIIKTLKTKYGIGMTKGIARIYTDTEMMRKIETPHIAKRHEPKKKKETEEA
jgi:small subunit ribosomal protein S24e